MENLSWRWWGQWVLGQSQELPGSPAAWLPLELLAILVHAVTQFPHVDSGNWALNLRS